MNGISKHIRLEVLNDFLKDICNIRDLLPLQDNPSIKSLHLSDNPVTGSKTYRQDVKRLLPQLQILDGESI